MNGIEILCDAGSFRAVSDGLESRDPLSYPGYRAALESARERAGTDESVIYGEARIEGAEVTAAAFNFAFMGGSMGEVAGERLARAMEHAAERRAPFVLYTETGGARMQEGMRALAQMARVAAARHALGAARVPFVAVLGNPTTGGVLASVAALADVAIAVRGSTIGFAGPRIVHRATGRPLPDDSHTAEAAYAAGLVDDLVTEDEVRDRVALALRTIAPPRPEPVAAPEPPAEVRLEGWAAVRAARSAGRPKAPDLLRTASETVVELRGDRSGGSDPALFAALARVAGRPLVALALDSRHLGGPTAFRTARRALRIAEHLDLPVVTLLDTRGADPSGVAEAGGIAWEIAATFDAMLGAPVPILAIVTGEGGSGGALALAAGDLLVCFEDAIFSVIAPEAAAEILWRDAGRAEEAARLLRVTAHDLRALGLADAVIAGPPSAGSVRAAIAYHLDLLTGTEEAGAARVAARRERWRRLS